MIKKIIQQNILTIMSIIKVINKKIEHNKLSILSKYKCKLGHNKCHLVLSGEYLLIEDKESTYRLSCANIDKISIDEKIWSIRVRFKYKGKVFKFDFPSLKKATQFYEQLIYSKVKSHVY